MTYRVEVAEAAKKEIRAAYYWLWSRSPESADNWLDGLEAAIATLSEFPHRCARARESREFDDDVRQLIYGKRRGRYRVLYRVTGKTVQVLHVRHGAQEALTEM